jgi:hypothetical protein
MAGLVPAIRAFDVLRLKDRMPDIKPGMTNGETCD